MLTSSSILVPPGGRSPPQEQSTRPSNHTAQAGPPKLLYGIPQGGSLYQGSLYHIKPEGFTLPHQKERQSSLEA